MAITWTMLRVSSSAISLSPLTHLIFFMLLVTAMSAIASASVEGGICLLIAHGVRDQSALRRAGAFTPSLLIGPDSPMTSQPSCPILLIRRTRVAPVLAILALRVWRRLRR